MPLAQHIRAPQRILVAERNLMQGELLTRALCDENDFEIIGTASDPKEVLRLVRRFEPGIAIVSTDLQGATSAGLDVIAQVRAKNSCTKTVALLDDSDPELVVGAFRNGARGIFFRTQPYTMFPKCLRAILEGQVWVNNNEIEYLLEALTRPHAPHLAASKVKSVLTSRESEIAQLIAEGLSNREIASKLSLSEHTIKNYVFRIFDKTGVSSRVSLVLYTFSQEQAWRTDNAARSREVGTLIS
jgi:two-component system nitrate/nitrite response regulator NarL